MNIKWPGQEVESQTENRVLSGHNLVTTCQRREAGLAPSLLSGCYGSLDAGA